MRKETKTRFLGEGIIEEDEKHDRRAVLIDLELKTVVTCPYLERGTPLSTHCSPSCAAYAKTTEPGVIATGCCRYPDREQCEDKGCKTWVWCELQLGDQPIGVICPLAQRHRSLRNADPIRD